MPRNIEYFNELVGLIFANLYESFPRPSELIWTDFAESMGVDVTETVTPRKSVTLHGSRMTVPERTKVLGKLEGTDIEFSGFFYSSVRWLEAEGFIRTATGSMTRRGRRASDVPRGITLTLKTMDVLGQTPKSLDQTTGEQLIELATRSVGDARRAAISEAVGITFGTMIRSAFGMHPPAGG